MQIYTLEAQTRLCKRYEAKDGELEVTPYPMVGTFTSSFVDVFSIDDLYQLVVATSENPYACLLKGELTRALHNESRAGSTSSGIKTQWLCLDFDYAAIEGKKGLDELLDQLGIGSTSYVLQYGSGHGIDKEFSAHVYMLIDEPVMPQQLKLWLMQKNLTVIPLLEAITLQKTGMALSWPLDITLAQNDKLIYTAPPTCIGFKNPVADEDRVQLVRKQRANAPIAADVSSLKPAPIKAAENKRINKLREREGLPGKKPTTRISGNFEIITNPDRCTVTSYKSERGFVYLNLNGGDSLAYYFPEGNPEIVYNFKGEPNYRLKDLDPDFYREYQSKRHQSTAAERGEPQPFAFLDRTTDTYYRGFYFPDEDQVEIYSTNSIKKLKDFAIQNGFELGDHVEEWDYKFKFDTDVVFSRQDRFINRFKPTSFLTADIASADLPNEIPPTILKVLKSVTGNDTDVIKRFMNWLACIIQYRQRTQTAWVFNGREGTGKGVLYNYILAPILGPEHCRTIRLSTLEEDMSNEYMENCVLLMIDEASVGQLQRNSDKVMAMLKNTIVEPYIPIRRMRTDVYMAQNFMNIIITSNHPDPIYISATDRRFNVGVYQNRKLDLTSEDIERIGVELHDFAKILRLMPADQELAKTPLDNEARERMMYLTETSVSLAAKALLSGNLNFFADALPSDPSVLTVPEQLQVENYTRVLREAEVHANKGTEHLITREQVQLLMKFIVGNVPQASTKFVNFMKHYGIYFERHRKGGAVPSAIIVKWNKPEFSINEILGVSETGTFQVVT